MAEWWRVWLDGGGCDRMVKGGDSMVEGVTGW